MFLCLNRLLSSPYLEAPEFPKASSLSSALNSIYSQISSKATLGWEKEESFPIPHSKRLLGFQWDCLGLKHLGKSHVASVHAQK